MGSGRRRSNCRHDEKDDDENNDRNGDYDLDTFIDAFSLRMIANVRITID